MLFFRRKHAAEVEVVTEGVTYCIIIAIEERGYDLSECCIPKVGDDIKS